MLNDIIYTFDYGERVTSTYAEIYFDDAYCHLKKSLSDVQSEQQEDNAEPSEEKIPLDKWKSPSDLLIGILELNPPFTSKITRGITHQGILAIGDEVLTTDEAKFIARVTELVKDNNVAWEFILDFEKNKIVNKIKKIYDKIFYNKSKVMIEECTKFYEKSLQELEEHLKSQTKIVLMSAHANVISDLNHIIKSKLKKEKLILNEILRNKYHIEVAKIQKYYKLLFNNETYKNTRLYNQALQEKNDALHAFVRQVEAETISSTMYVMCAERKKCKIKQFIVENYQTLEISEKIKKIQEKQRLLDDFKKKDQKFSCINKEWEEKIKKITQLFLKFISFSLKLLPEQTTFLLDLEKMVVLQLNELQKVPTKAPSILVEENVFKFEKTDKPPKICTKTPFEIVGDTAVSTPIRYGSSETIPPDVDLPFVRLQRQYIYAKCHKFEEVKAFLESQKCKCILKSMNKELSHVSVTENLPVQEPSEHTPTSESNNERILFDNFGRTGECLSKHCKNWAKRSSFPYLESYLDYSEEKFQRLKIILGKPPKKDLPPERLLPEDMVYREVPYVETKEKSHNAGTQYSSQEELNINLDCDCVGGSTYSTASCSHYKDENPQKFIDEMIAKRKKSLQRLMQEHPKLLKIFTDESFDFSM